MSSPDPGLRAPEIAERFVKQLNVAYKAVRLYPPASAIPRESAAAALGTLRAMLREDAEVRISVSKEGLMYEGALVYPGQPAFVEFAREFFGRRLAEVRFHAGATAGEIIEFLRTLDMPLADIQAVGGFEARMWEAHVVNITVRESTTRIVEHTGLPDVEEFPVDWPPEPETIDEILADFAAGRQRDQVVLVRLVESPKELAEYLRRSAEGRGATPGSAWLTNRVSALASSVLDLDPEEAAPRIRAIADGLLSLDEDVLSEALSDRLLPAARHDDALARVVQQGGVDYICQVLARGLEATEESRDGLTRAFRNLLHISDLDRGQVLGAAADALEKAGAPATTTDAILAAIDPAEIKVKEAPRVEEASPIERIIRLVDMAPITGDADPEDPDCAQLRSEARQGISDGDVMGAVVSLITIEHRDEQFGSLMSMIEDGLDLLITRGEYHVAAGVTDALSETSQDLSRPDHQRTRMKTALDALASKRNTRAIAAAMRRHEAGSTEHEACKHLLTVLGSHAVEPLLEVLADEPDMTARKALVALISEVAEQHIGELGSHLADGRWYFVRNVVTILGATRTPETLVLLGRTLRYPDARVRRETIRAVAGIRDALAVEMLLAALEDTDPQNVQLAARHLGLIGQQSAIGGLERVATGHGTGNREVAARIEAIEALGRLGSTGSLELLRSLTRTRGIRGRARSRELAAAAAAAIRAIELAGSSGEVTS